MQTQPPGRYFGLKYRLRPRIHTWDRINILSPVPKDELAEMLPLKELAQYGKPNKYGNMLFEASNTAKSNTKENYLTKLDACCCTDEFIEILKGYDFGNITHLQVCEDIVFKTCEEAQMYLDWFDLHMKRNWERNSFKLGRRYRKTLYRGKRRGKRSRNYGRAYINRTDDKKFRHEFTFDGKATINRVLKINHISELKTCEQTYRMLKDRYLKRPYLSELRSS